MGDKTRGAETGGDQTGGGKTAAASPPAATSSPAAAEQRRRLPQLSLWQRARGEGGGARHLLGGVQHLWQEVGAREIPNTSLRRQTNTIKYETQQQYFEHFGDVEGFLQSTTYPYLERTKQTKNSRDRIAQEQMKLLLSSLTRSG